MPLGSITLKVTFSDTINFQKKKLSFKLVDFNSTYNAILGRQCYAKFMEILSYAYHKLKVIGPCNVIIVSRALQWCRC